MCVRFPWCTAAWVPDCESKSDPGSDAPGARTGGCGPVDLHAGGTAGETIFWRTPSTKGWALKDAKVEGLRWLRQFQQISEKALKAIHYGQLAKRVVFGHSLVQLAAEQAVQVSQRVMELARRTFSGP